MTSAVPATILAELSASAEAIGEYQRRVGRLAIGLGADRDDLLRAIEEAERALGVAVRTIRRAMKVAASG
jgi:hypothetical protein